MEHIGNTLADETIVAVSKMKDPPVWLGELERSRTRHPKDNAGLERFNRTLQEEFLREGNAVANPIEFNRRLTQWLIEYNFFRPHAALGYKCPIQVMAPAQEALPMYPSPTTGAAN